MSERLGALVIGATTAVVICLAGESANATPIGPDCEGGSCNGGIYELTSDGVDIGASITDDTFRVTLTVSNAANIIDTLAALGGDDPFYIDSIAIKVSSSATSAVVFDAPDAAGNPGGQVNWSIVDGGINASGCSGSGGGFECADWITLASFGALLSDGNDLSWTLDITMPTGTFFGVEGTEASIKARFVEVVTTTKHGVTTTEAEKIGELLSENITVQSPTTVPEPAPLAVIGMGLIALGGLHTFRRRRHSMGKGFTQATLA